MPLGVKVKVLEIEPKKILRPDPGLYSQYFPSYDIFCDPQTCNSITTYCGPNKYEDRLL